MAEGEDSFELAPLNNLNNNITSTPTMSALPMVSADSATTVTAISSSNLLRRPPRQRKLRLYSLLFICLVFFAMGVIRMRVSHHLAAAASSSSLFYDDASQGTHIIAPTPVSNKNSKEEIVLPAVASTSTAAYFLPMHAADALQCRESVVNFVINATDGKDECDGLKRAYDKTCNSHSQPEQGQGHRRRRLLLARTTYWQKTAHVYDWRVWMWRTSDYFVSSWRKVFDYINNENRRPFFFAEEAVTQPLAWQRAIKMVDHDLDRRVHALQIRRWRLAKAEAATATTPITPAGSRRKRNADGANATIHGDNNHIDDDDDDAKLYYSFRHLEETLINNNKTKPHVHLDLPTASKHVSDQTASESFLLQEGDSLLEQQQQQQQNKNNESMTSILANNQQDAQTSSKAVSDTTQAMHDLLNDPSSKEARVCCASILNVYHDNCSTDEEEEVSDGRLFLVVLVMALCGMVKSLIRHYKVFWLPEAAGCILVGGAWRMLLFFSLLRLRVCRNANHVISIIIITCFKVLSGYVIELLPHHSLSFDGNWFLRVLVPPIVFEAAIGIDKRSFNRHIVPILFYAIAGTLLATVLTAYVVHQASTWLQPWCHAIPYVEALTFGALISSIDPIAVLSVMSNMGMNDTDTIYVIIFGESLLNDGVAIVLFQTLVHFLDENLVIDRDAVYAASMHFLVVAIGSCLVGVASGMLSTLYYFVFRGCQTPHVEVLMFLCWALLPYYICDGIGWSGIVAAVAAGFCMDLYIIGQKEDDSSDDSESLSISHNGGGETPSRRGERRSFVFGPKGHLSEEARTHIGFVTEMIATVMETAIFAYLGLFLFSHRYHWNFWHTVIAIFACCSSRAVMIPVLSLVANWITAIQQVRVSCSSQPYGRRTVPSSTAGVIIDRKMQLVLWFAGLRGAMSFALVEHIPMYDSTSGEGTRWKPELKAMTSACIMFTVFVLGGYTYYMMEYMGMAPSNDRNRPATFELTSLMSSKNVSDPDLNGDMKDWKGSGHFGREDDEDSRLHRANGGQGTAVRRQRAT